MAGTHELLGLEAIPGPQVFSLALPLPPGKVGGEGQDAGLISYSSVSSHPSQYPNPAVLCLHSATRWGADGSRVHERE